MLDKDPSLALQTHLAENPAEILLTKCSYTLPSHSHHTDYTPISRYGAEVADSDFDSIIP